MRQERIKDPNLHAAGELVRRFRRKRPGTGDLRRCQGHFLHAAGESAPNERGETPRLLWPQCRSGVSPLFFKGCASTPWRAMLGCWPANPVVFTGVAKDFETALQHVDLRELAHSAAFRVAAEEGARRHVGE